jgi:hypothetical protein
MKALRMDSRTGGGVEDPVRRRKLNKTSSYEYRLCLPYPLSSRIHSPPQKLLSSTSATCLPNPLDLVVSLAPFSRLQLNTTAEITGQRLSRPRGICPLYPWISRNPKSNLPSQHRVMWLFLAAGGSPDTRVLGAKQKKKRN